MSPRILVLQTVLRATATLASMVALYYILPLRPRLSVNGIVELVAGLVALAVLAAWQIRAIVRARHPGSRAVTALSTLIPLFLLLFAEAYFVMAQAQPTAFSEPLTRTDALYFTITVFATVGFGDITPVSENARVVVMSQMIMNLLVLGVLLKLVMGAVRTTRHRQAPAERHRDRETTGELSDDW